MVTCYGLDGPLAKAFGFRVLLHEFGRAEITAMSSPCLLYSLDLISILKV